MSGVPNKILYQNRCQLRAICEYGFWLVGNATANQLENGRSLAPISKNVWPVMPSPVALEIYVNKELCLPSWCASVVYHFCVNAAVWASFCAIIVKVWLRLDRPWYWYWRSKSSTFLTIYDISLDCNDFTTYHWSFKVYHSLFHRMQLNKLEGLIDPYS